MGDVPEAPLEQTADGLVPAGPGWFVLNAREARWRERPGRGRVLSFTGTTDAEVEWFPQLGANLFVLGAGDTIGMYHWEADQEGFLVLSGEALLLIEGEERPLRQWDYVHVPARVEHMVVGAGSGCVVLGIGARQHQEGDGWGGYTVAEVARRHGVGVEQETSDAAVAYARFEPGRPVSYREGTLPN